MAGICYGQLVRFAPAAFTGEQAGSSKKKPEQARGRSEPPRTVTGRIDYINRRHRWYNVRYELNGYVLHEGFKF